MRSIGKEKFIDPHADILDTMDAMQRHNTRNRANHEPNYCRSLALLLSFTSEVFRLVALLSKALAMVFKHQQRLELILQV